MLTESLKDPRLRKKWEAANAELASLDRAIAAGTGAAPARTPDPVHAETVRGESSDSESDSARSELPCAR